MSVTDQIEKLGAKAVEVCTEIATTKARFEALDKEVHRMMDAMQKLLDKYERDNAELTRRVTILEAQFKAVYEQAVMKAVTSTFQPLVRQAVADELAKSEFRTTRPVLDATPPTEGDGAAE
jgi:hypothetical protein